ncbi:MAG: tetratricopeptide repeat protein [Candidatus Solibacter usitatus]|nr:tetratricopeptide repeat protein [Candidatus Solibacter usitatus]
MPHSRKLLAALAFLSISQAQAEPRWQKLASGRWELLTDGGPTAGAAVLARLLEMDAAFRATGWQRPDAAPAVRVILFRRAQDFAAFRSAPNNRGLFQPGPGRDLILLAGSGEDTLRAARHEYVHLALHHSTGPLPQWLEEGLAEYFSTLVPGSPRAAGRAIAGKPVQAHLELLDRESWMDSSQLASVANRDPVYTDSRASTLFYAQSWALTHLLMQAPAAHRRIAAFQQAMRAGKPQQAAFAEAFNLDFPGAMAAARAAVSARQLPEREVALGLVPPSSAFSVTGLSGLDSRLARAEALLACGQTAEAEAAFQDSARKWPESPAAVAGLGYAALRRSDYDAARAQLERAIALGDKSASTQFEYAMLVRDTRGPQALVMQSLERAVESNPSFAEAWFFLGAGQLRQGRAQEAAAALERAVEILPRQSMFWEALARARQATGDNVAARASALRAVEAASTPQQSEMARGALREIESNSSPRPPAKPPVTTPGTWAPPQGDSSVTGKLVLLDCGAASVTFHVETRPAAGKTPAERVILFTEKLNQVMLKGASSARREFVCGPQKPAPLVEAGYLAGRAPTPPPPPASARPPAKAPPKSAPKASAKAAARPRPAPPPIAGELVTLEFK